MYRSTVTGRSSDLNDGSPDDLPESWSLAQVCHHANVVRRALGLQPLAAREFVRVTTASDHVSKDVVLAIEPEFALTIAFEVIESAGAVSRDAVQPALVEYERLLVSVLREADEKRTQGDYVAAALAYLAAHLPREAAIMRDSIDPEVARESPSVLRAIDSFIEDQLKSSEKGAG